MSKKNEKVIIENINAFIKDNPRIFIHKVEIGGVLFFYKKYDEATDLGEVINDIYHAYLKIFASNEEFNISKDNYKILLEEVFNVREEARALIPGTSPTTKIYKIDSTKSYTQFPSGITESLRSEDQINDLEMEILEKICPADLEENDQYKLDKHFNTIIENCFNLPYFEQEAYKLRIDKRQLLIELNQLKLKLKPAKEAFTNSNSSEIPILRMTETDIKKIKARENEIYEQLIDFKGSQLAKSFDPDGILKLQKRAYIRIFVNWETTIKNNVIKYLSENNVTLNESESIC